MSAHANGRADDFHSIEQRTSGWVQRWGGPLGTVGSVIVALFMLWHQIDLSLQVQQAQVTALQAQIDRMEGRIYALTAASPCAADQR